ncbi:MAG: NADPH:qui reductase or related Zn-dependent oxidoreductase [Verrucomicrobiales bacterium]|nr:NADPH:qui reductase or related Zn-dependent oxidoreductase [Verrucomicrobiales bacterium]
MKTFELTKFGLENLVLAERDRPRPDAQEVLIKFHAASLNFRDLMFAKGIYNPHAKLPAIPFSDGAGEVVELGSAVTRWQVGDRVCPIFNQGWLEGDPSAARPKSTLGGGDLDGVLREYGVFHEQGLVSIPEHLSYEDAATLPCAGVAAWHALVTFGRLKAGESVLTLGTGGVSIFALQFAKAHGARVIATSSSDEKLARARTLGADEVINYKNTPDWEKEVLRLTGGVGVDHVVEVGGAGTLQKSASSTRVFGRIAVIGVLASGSGLNPVGLVMKSIRMQGIFVGSRQMFEEMNRAITVNHLQPVVSKSFSFEEVPDALRYMEASSHFGKIVVRY